MWPQSFLRQKVVRAGREEILGDFDRGPLLLYTKDEWRRRIRPEMIRDCALFTGIFGLFIPGLAYLGIIISYLMGTPLFARENTVYWLIVIGSWGILLFFTILFVANYGPIVPALYQKGVQSLGRYFIPYEEIDELIIKDTEGRFSWKYVEIIVGGNDGPDRKEDTHRIPLRLLGPDGFALFQSLVAEHRTRTERPDLHLYGPRKGWGGNG